MRLNTHRLADRGEDLLDRHDGGKALYHVRLLEEGNEHPTAQPAHLAVVLPPPDGVSGHSQELGKVLLSEF